MSTSDKVMISAAVIALGGMLLGIFSLYQSSSWRQEVAAEHALKWDGIEKAAKTATERNVVAYLRSEIEGKHCKEGGPLSMIHIDKTKVMEAERKVVNYQEAACARILLGSIAVSRTLPEGQEYAEKWLNAIITERNPNTN